MREYYESMYLIRSNLIVVLWYNGSRLATLLNGIEVPEACRSQPNESPASPLSFSNDLSFWDFSTVE